MFKASEASVIFGFLSKKNYFTKTQSSIWCAVEEKESREETACLKQPPMTEYDSTIELGVLEEEALQSIETLLEELGREPLPMEVKFFNSYNKVFSKDV